MENCNKHRTRFDKTNVSTNMEFGNEIPDRGSWIHNSDNTVNSTILSVTPLSNNGKKYSITIVGDFINMPLYDSRVIANGTEGVIYYTTVNLPTIYRPYTFYRIASVPTTDTVNTTFDIIIIDNQKEIIEVFGKALELGIPHVNDNINWPLVFQNIYNNNTVVCKISVSSNGENNIKFKWEDYSNASVYYRIIYRKFTIDIFNTDVWTETDLIVSTPGVYHEFMLSGLDKNIKYEWSVMSYYSEDLKQFSSYYQPAGEFVFS